MGKKLSFGGIMQKAGEDALPSQSGTSFQVSIVMLFTIEKLISTWLRRENHNPRDQFERKVGNVLTFLGGHTGTLRWYVVGLSWCTHAALRIEIQDSNPL
jgi:hypothetical protein